jgi:ribosomal protein S18 acetylase RimI-like enzyme
VQKKDFTRAGLVLADAFQYDPLWNKIWGAHPAKEQQFSAFFQGAVRYCHRYGQAYATSVEMEGIAGWLSDKYADMTPWRMLLCGSMGVMMKEIMKTGWQSMKKMGSAMKPVVDDRHENMIGKRYLYLTVIGVATGQQGKGYGRQLLDVVIEQSESEGVPLYLETETEENVKMYQHFGFKLLKEITLPIVEAPMWEMVREPGC